MIRKALKSVAFSSCLVFGCSSSSSTPAATTDTGTPSTDAATETAAVMVKDQGTVVDYGSGSPVKEITVAELGVTGTTDGTGKFSLSVPKDTPLNMVLTGTDYTKMFLGEQSFSADFDRGDIPVPPLGLFHVAQTSLMADTTKGMVYLLIEGLGSCTDISGGTVKVNAPAGAKVAYFKDKFPDTAVTSIIATEGHLPVVTLYDVPPGAALDLTITHPTCKQKAFPATVRGVTYSGKVTIEGGDANSVAFYFLE